MTMVFPKEPKDPVIQYLETIAQYPLLSVQEEKELGRKIALGKKSTNPIILSEAEKAKQELMLRNLRLVVSIAKRFQRRGMDFLDLIQEANIGLKKAIDKYDWTKNNRFSTYAHWWVWQQCIRTLQDKGSLIRLPVRHHEQKCKIGKVIRNLRSEGKEVTPDAIASCTNLTVKQIKESLDLSRIANPVSINNQAYDLDVEWENLLGESVKDTYFDLLSEHVYQVLEKLLPEDKTVLQLIYGIGCEKISITLIAQKLGVSRGRIKQRQQRAIAYFRENHAHLKDFLED